MSRPRSRSPRYRRFPWDEPGFDSYRGNFELDGNSFNKNHRPRDGSAEHLDYRREDAYPESQRRSPAFLDDYRLRHRHPDQEEFYHKRLPHHSNLGYDDQSLSPLHDVGEGERSRGAFREHGKRLEDRGRSPHTPHRLAKERSQSHSDHQQRDPGTSWRDEQSRDRGRFRDLTPIARSDEKRVGAGRERGGRRTSQGFNRDRHREELHQEKNPPFKRQRREMDDSNQLGYRNEENFGIKRYSLDTPRGGGHQGSLPHMSTQHLRPLIIEHGHGIADNRDLPRWEQFKGRRGFDPDFDHQRGPHPKVPTQERFRSSDSRPGDREDPRGYRLQHHSRGPNYPESRRSPVQQDRPNSMRYDKDDGPNNFKERNGPRSARGRLDQGQTGWIGPPRNQPYLKQPCRGLQDLPYEEQRPGYRPLKEDRYEDPIEQDPNWSENNKQQELDRPGSQDRYPPSKDLDPKMPRQRKLGWNVQKTDNMTVVAEETLTIKVDMSRPVTQNSSLCYSSDRQLSLDLVNVGRQRLDFLPMLEHSGTYRETTTHTGTFAQEIISLVHQVKEQYFRDDGVTLNERFSAPQKGGCSEEEMDELTLNERFSSNRGFSLNLKSLLDNDLPLFSRLGRMQGLNQHPVRDPGDLRHDLERRRQERLEGVKVTISGSRLSVCSPASFSELGVECSDKDEGAQIEEEGFSSWPQDQSRRWEGNTRRAGPPRLNTGPLRNGRITRGGPRGGQMRRPNNRINHAGPSW